MSISDDTLVVGATDEQSNATGINGTQSDNSLVYAGAAYVFVRSGTTWTQQAYLKASNTDSLDRFGSVSVSGDTVVVGAIGEASNAMGIDGDQSNDSASDSGAAYVFTVATMWTGATDSDWSDASNWTNGVPDSTLIAIIPDATTTANDPSITVSGQACNTLWIQPGATLDISAGMDSLGVFAGATVEGPITGTGQLVFGAAGTLTGDSTIGLTFSPAVRADAILEFQGGPLSIAGSFRGNADVHVASGATIDIDGAAQVAADLGVDGNLGVGNGLDVGGTLSSSSSSHLDVRGTGACVVASELCAQGPVTTSCTLSVERSIPDTSNFEATSGWPADVVFDVAGTVNQLTADLVISGDLLVRNGTLALGVDCKITTGGANGIRIADGDSVDPIALFDIGDRLLQVPAAEGITIGNRGKLNIGEGGELELAGTLTVENGGTLCLDGVPSDRASISSYLTNRYTLTLDPGATLAAKGFAFSGMTSSGMVIGSGVSLAAAPYDLRAGVFDDPASSGVLLDIERSSPTELRYLEFDNSLSAAGVASVRTSLASAVLTLVNWSGDLAPDAATAEAFDDDPGESSPPELILWLQSQASDVQDFVALPGPGHAIVSWTTLSEIDSDAFVVQRSPEPPGAFTTVGERPSAGSGSYSLADHGIQAQTAYRYRLLERLTHGELRYVGEAMLPAPGAPDWFSPAPPTPPGPFFVVGDGGAYPDVRTALRQLARSGQSTPVTLELARGKHEPFELGSGLAFDLCLVARPGAVIDAAQAPVRIEGLGAQRSVELVGLTIDAQRAPHPALVVENARGVVLMQDVELRGSASGPELRLANARAVAIQGGAVERGLLLERGSRATASGVRLGSFELTGGSVLETRGEGGPKVEQVGTEGTLGRSPAVPVEARVEPGSRWIAHPTAPQLSVEFGMATLDAEGPGLAWLGLARRLGFQARARPWIEGVLLLDPAGFETVGAVRMLTGGKASWHLGPLPSGAPVYLQGLVLDPNSGRICLSDVVR